MKMEMVFTVINEFVYCKSFFYDIVLYYRFPRKSTKTHVKRWRISLMKMEMVFTVIIELCNIMS